MGSKPAPLRGFVGSARFCFRVKATLLLFAQSRSTSSVRVSGDNEWTMSQENVEVVREGFEAFKRGDLEQAFSMLSAEVSWDGVSGVEPCRTREEVERTIRLNYEAGSPTEAEEFIDA